MTQSAGHRMCMYAGVTESKSPPDSVNLPLLCPARIAWRLRIGKTIVMPALALRCRSARTVPSTIVRAPT